MHLGTSLRLRSIKKEITIRIDPEFWEFICEICTERKITPAEFIMDPINKTWEDFKPGLKE